MLFYLQNIFNSVTYHFYWQCKFNPFVCHNFIIKAGEVTLPRSYLITYLNHNIKLRLSLTNGFISADIHMKQ